MKGRERSLRIYLQTPGLGTLPPHQSHLSPRYLIYMNRARESSRISTENLPIPQPEHRPSPINGIHAFPHLQENMLSRQLQSVSSRSAALRIPRPIVAPRIRTYAQPAGPDSKPPMALYGLDGTYASALV